MNKFIPVLGVLGIGGVAGLGTALSHSMSDKETIKDKLLRDGFKTLKGEASEWSAILSSYKGTNNIWKFKKEHTGMEGEIQNESELKRACSSVLKLDSSLSGEAYKSATKWCVVPKKVEEFVSGLLGVVESDESDVSQWKHNVDTYKGTKKASENKYEWDDVVFGGSNNDKEDTKQLKKGCKTRREKLTYDVGFDNAIREVKERCLAKGRE
ncbi:hypothetical protein MHC_01690 [Mycoplasma haemocanis str. Illinois]|uniref:Uncharacterized protein n=1 Tax=Mycoplasma haemocanis (strain Illinois) TaxID=1111676 RepID=H6N6D2_MYCHN|nr:hypothetical protein [Mycoplasma haemocanis]AEW45204.1 hypothetical protein MHC_01690 [Mycoplasma haemocanis str. Illinois]